MSLRSRQRTNVTPPCSSPLRGVACLRKEVGYGLWSQGGRRRLSSPAPAKVAILPPGVGGGQYAVLEALGFQCGPKRPLGRGRSGGDSAPDPVIPALPLLPGPDDRGDRRGQGDRKDSAPLRAMGREFGPRSAPYPCVVSQMFRDRIPAGFTLNNPLRSAMLPPREKANSYESESTSPTGHRGLLARPAHAFITSSDLETFRPPRESSASASGGKRRGPEHPGTPRRQLRRPARFRRDRRRRTTTHALVRWPDDSRHGMS